VAVVDAAVARMSAVALKRSQPAVSNIYASFVCIISIIVSIMVIHVTYEVQPAYL
jgi:hypothetical protein